MKKISLSVALTIATFFNLAAQENAAFKADALARNTSKLNEKERMDLLSKIYMDYQLQISPEFGTMIGKPTDNRSWTDFSLAAIAQRKKDRIVFLEAIHSISRDKLDPASQLNFDILKNTIELDQEGEKFPSELMPINKMSGVHQMIASMGSATPFNNKKDVEDFIARLSKTPALVDQLIALMNEGIKKGVMPPEIAMSGVLEQISNMTAGNPGDSPIIKSLKDYLSKLPASESKDLSAASIKVVAEKVNPALTKLQSYLQTTYIPKTRKSIALKDSPDGENWYNYNIKVQTTTSLNYKQIHEIGLSEVKRIRSLMDSVILATKFKGSFNDFLEFLRTDKQFFYDKPEDLIAGYRVIAKRIDPELPRFFGKLPRLPYGVIPVPDYDAKFQTTAYYNSGSIAAGRPGYFYANTYDLKSRPKWEMEALTIHEAVPGHHLQIALAEELENVPEFRKYTSFTGFVEGWGLYSESLGVEMGFYTDPYSKFGQLTYEMWRAVRLVVDTGMHGMGWTREQAIEYFKANAAKTQHDIEVEIDRYITWPGQALAYKIGELKIKELRAFAHKELGVKFDLRKFHDVVLMNGSIPLEVLEIKVKEWVNASR